MERLEGRKVVVFYDDLGHVSRKDGVVTCVSEAEYVLDNRIIIPKRRIIRVEVLPK